MASLRFIAGVLLLCIVFISMATTTAALKKEKLGIAFLVGHLLGGKKHAFINLNTQPQVLPYPIPWPVGGGGGGGGGGGQADQGRVEHVYKETHVHHFYKDQRPHHW